MQSQTCSTNALFRMSIDSKPGAFGESSDESSCSEGEEGETDEHHHHHHHHKTQKPDAVEKLS